MSGAIINNFLGDYSNWVGSQYFNLEDELSILTNDEQKSTSEIMRSKMFRTTANAVGRETSVARAISVVKQGRIGTAADVSGDMKQAQSMWCGEMETHHLGDDNDNRQTNSFMNSLALEDLESDLRYLLQKQQQQSQKVRNKMNQNSNRGRGRGRSSYDDYDDDDEDGYEQQQQQQHEDYSIVIKDLQTRIELLKLEMKSNQTNNQTGAGENMEFDPNAVKHWSEFLKVQTSHKSIYELPGLHIDDEDTFQLFHEGTILFQKYTEEEEITDRLRYFAEEADFLDGFHVIFDANTGFSGIANGLMNHMNDYYSKVPIFAAGCFEPTDETMVNGKHVSLRRALNTSYVMTEITQAASIYTTLTVPFNTSNIFGISKLDTSSKIQTASVLATAFHSMTMPYRTSSSNINMSSFCNEMIPFSKLNIMDTTIAFPCDVNNNWLLNSIDSSNDDDSNDNTDNNNLLKLSSLGMEKFQDSVRVERKERIANSTSDTVIKNDHFYDNTGEKLYQSCYIVRGSDVLNDNIAKMKIKNNHNNSININSLLSSFVNENKMIIEFHEPVPLPIPYPISMFDNITDDYRMPMITELRSTSERHKELSQLSKVLKMGIFQNDMNRTSHDHLNIEEYRHLVDDISNLVSEYRYD